MSDDAQGAYQSDLWEMKVSEIEFGLLVRSKDSEERRCRRAKHK